ncbi:MAG TPA: hypothetical protein VGQ33_21990, partial [Vicinamibacteria bacterium]|nr:hypothetical protein [Vicinamibacteria bacterium]
RWLVSGVPGPVTLSVSPARTSPGAPVTLAATVTDGAFLKVNDARVVAHVKEPSGAERELPLEWSVGKDGEYTGALTPRDAGAYEVRVDATRAGATLGTVTAQVQAAALDTEFFGAEMQRPRLEQLARETGGRFYTARTVRSLPDDIRYGGGGATVQEEKPLWDMPALYLAIVGLVSVEWAYRKRRGLA